MDQSPVDSQINSEAGRMYWEGATADDEGMLGGISGIPGFSSLSKIDLQGSHTFLARLGFGTKNGRRSAVTALEGGAGIGRVTEGVLLQVVEQVDVIEPVSKFTSFLEEKPGVRHVFNVGIEEWRPVEGAEYDLIWLQWCLLYLTDKQLIQFLHFCKSVLRKEGGVIVIKENLSTSGKDVYDAEDNSVTRQDVKFRRLFDEAGLRLVRVEPQRGLPETSTSRLLPVHMYALQPKKEETAAGS